MLALIDEWPGILADRAGAFDLRVHLGDLRGEGVDLTHRLRDRLIDVALEAREVGRGLIESAGEILRCGDDPLTEIEIAGIGGELRKAGEESSQRRLEAGP